MMTENPRVGEEPVLRVVPAPSDINANGHIFGGWILSQMDIAGGIVAGRRARGPVATIAIDSMKFHQPILLGDVVSIYGNVTRVGRTSIAIHLDVIAVRRRSSTYVRVTEGLYTFVALDADARPRPVDQPAYAQPSA
jgi:acyl-CoA thioesterase YciA